MTTIAYNHKDKELAFDSRVSSNHTIISDSFNKSIRQGDCIFVLAGGSADCMEFAKNFTCEHESQGNYDGCEGFMVNNGVAFFVTHNGKSFSKMLLSFDMAAGSGCDHAITAMDLGLSAKDAVKMAIKRDFHSGGRVGVIKV